MEELRALVAAQLGELGLDLRRERNDLRGFMALRHRFSQGAEVLSLVPGELLLGDVRGVQDRFHREQRERTKELQLVRRESRLPQSPPFFQEVVRALNHWQLGLG